MMFGVQNALQKILEFRLGNGVFGLQNLIPDSSFSSRVQWQGHIGLSLIPEFLYALAD